MSIRIDLSDLTSNFVTDEQITEAWVDDIHTKMGLDLLAGLIVATPVDEGTARNGWQIAGTGQITTVENMVPYIGVLNDGHSKQSPAGFVESEIDKVTRL